MEQRKLFCRAMQANKVAHTLKRSPELPEVFWQSILRAKREGGCCGVCDELMHSSLIGWGVCDELMHSSLIGWC